MHETHSRSIAKGITWRIVASLTTMGLVYGFTENLSLMASVGVLEFVAKVFFYYGHERIWMLVSWGKRA